MSMHTHATNRLDPHSSHDHGTTRSARTSSSSPRSMVLLFLHRRVPTTSPSRRYKTGEGDLGWVNTAVALMIASFKASLVVLIFMHLRHSTKLTWVVATAGFVWLCVMILFTFADYLSRNTIMESVRDTPYQVQAGTHANGTVLAKEPEKDYDSTPGW